jgi:DNA-binding transcriptional ArsR family regulator
METTQAIQALSALAQESRLAIFRLLIQQGPSGLAAGAIGEKLDLPPATLSFHLSGLVRAGLAHSRQDGRFVYYTANFENMNRELLRWGVVLASRVPTRSRNERK